MIRRDATLTDARPGWLLISQVDHARISGELAAACRPDVLLGREGGEDSHSQWPDMPAVLGEVLAAIAHHDDGWREWETAPGLDAAGRPLSFTELPILAALRIWSASIAAASTIGPLAGWMVAGHFRWLLDHSESFTRDPLADLWRATHDRQRDLQLDEWLFAAPQAHCRSIAEAALKALRAFDVASLWLCCGCVGFDGAERDEEAIACGPATLEFADGVKVQLLPGARGAVARPWIFTPSELEFRAPCLQVPARRYESPQELLAASEPGELSWTIRPPSAGE